MPQRRATVLHCMRDCGAVQEKGTYMSRVRRTSLRTSSAERNLSWLAGNYLSQWLHHDGFDMSCIRVSFLFLCPFAVHSVDASAMPRPWTLLKRKCSPVWAFTCTSDCPRYGRNCELKSKRGRSSSTWEWTRCARTLRWETVALLCFCSANSLSFLGLNFMPYVCLS